MKWLLITFAADKIIKADEIGFTGKKRRQFCGWHIKRGVFLDGRSGGWVYYLRRLYV